MTPTTALYHYCAMYQLPNGNLAYSDGFIQTDADLSSKRGGEQIRAALAERFDTPVPPTSITILSFTRLSP